MPMKMRRTSHHWGIAGEPGGSDGQDEREEPQDLGHAVARGVQRDKQADEEEDDQKGSDEGGVEEFDDGEPGGGGEGLGDLKVFGLGQRFDGGGDGGSEAGFFGEGGIEGEKEVGRVEGRGDSLAGDFGPLFGGEQGFGDGFVGEAGFAGGGVFKPTDFDVGGDHGDGEGVVVVVAVAGVEEIGGDGAEGLGAFFGAHGDDFADGVDPDGGAVADEGVGAHNDFVAGEGDDGAGGVGFVVDVDEGSDVFVGFDEIGDFQGAGDDSAVGVEVDDDGFGAVGDGVVERGDEVVFGGLVDFVMKLDDGRGTGRRARLRGGPSAERDPGD